MKIKFYATKQKAETGFKAMNPQLVSEQLRGLKGRLVITIEEIEGDATDSQIWHIQSIVVPTLVSLSIQHGDTMTEAAALSFLLEKFTSDTSLEQLAENGKQAVSAFIDNSKQFIRDFFNTNII